MIYSGIDGKVNSPMLTLFNLIKALKAALLHFLEGNASQLPATWIQLFLILQCDLQVSQRQPISFSLFLKDLLALRCYLQQSAVPAVLTVIRKRLRRLTEVAAAAPANAMASREVKGSGITLRVVVRVAEVAMKPCRTLVMWASADGCLRTAAKACLYGQGKS